MIVAILYWMLQRSSQVPVTNVRLDLRAKKSLGKAICNVLNILFPTY